MLNLTGFRRLIGLNLLIILLIFLSLSVYSVRFLEVGGGSQISNFPSQSYDPYIGTIKTLDGLEQVARRYRPNTGNVKRDMAASLTTVVELRSVHGISRQTWRENWIGNVLDRIDFEGMSFTGKMRPEDLVKDNIAFCSQSSAVLQELFRRNGIEQATVRFNVGGAPPHSAVAANPDGVWRYYDPSYEPKQQGLPFNTVVSKGGFLKLYSDKRFTERGIGAHFEILAEAGKIRIINVNGEESTRGIIFQRFCTILSVHGWLIPMAFALLLLFFKSYIPQTTAKRVIYAS